MKIRQLLIVLCSLASTSLPAQTKRIAFESHSGNMNNFNIALNNELFDDGNADFGLPASKTAYKLDSVIFISDTATVIVSKVYSRPWSATSDAEDKFVSAKKDTIYNDALFSRRHSLDSIKNVIKQKNQNFEIYEASSKTVFVGYDNKKEKDKKEKDKLKQQLLPLAITNDPPDNNSPFDIQLALMIGTILLLSLLGGLLTWKFYQPKLQ